MLLRHINQDIFLTPLSEASKEKVVTSSILFRLTLNLILLLANIHSKVLKRQDDVLHSRNSKLQEAYNQKVSAEHDYLLTLDGKHSDKQIEQASKKKDSKTKLYEKAITESLSGIGTGSGKVGILLPSM